MPIGVSPSTQGAAIDFWLRIPTDSQPSIVLPLIGLLSGRAPCEKADVELLAELARDARPRQMPSGQIELRMHLAPFTDRGDEWWARVCYALALMVGLYR